VSTELVAWLERIARNADAVPRAARLIAAADRAMRGDPSAAAYLRDAGLYDGLELLQPGVGVALRDVLGRTRGALTDARRALGGEIIEGSYRVLEDDEGGAGPAPWLRFQRWLASRRWGAWVVLGPKGEGKTTLAVRLAEVWAARFGYAVEGVNLYHEDRPDWLEPIGLHTLKRRMEFLAAYLGVDPDELEEGGGQADQADEADEPRAAAVFRRLQRRVILIDEASLAMGSHSSDVGRRVARQAMAQARHLQWHVVYAAQLTKQLATDLLAAEAVMVKRPLGSESELDRREPLVQGLWSDAAAAFDWLESRGADGAELRGPWRAAYPDVRSWAFVDCRKPRYRGLMPFSRPGDELGDREGESDAG
jgi:hypothetical protein